MTLRRRRRSAECASDFVFDALLGGDLPDEESQRVLAHARDCEPCRRRWGSLTLERAAFASLPPLLPGNRSPNASGHSPFPLPRRTGSAPRHVRWALAAATLLGLFVVIGRLARDEARPSDGLKGDGRLGFFVKRGDRVVRGGEASVLHPGDTLQFTYTSSEPGYIAVLSRDPLRQLSVYYPNAARAVPIVAGEQILPQGTVLDETLGTETLVALFCTRPIELEPVRLAWERAGASTPEVEGCTIDTLGVRKEAP